MHIKSLTINNFLAIGSDCPTLHLGNRGLVLIEGLNGVGKSTIPDALCWVFYNITARGETGDAVINNKAKKDCHVMVEFDDDGQCYRIQRFRKSKAFKNAVRVWKETRVAEGPSSGWADITLATDKDTQTLIERILGCSREVFTAAIYAGQEAMPDLPRMTDKELKAIIEEAAGINQLEQAYQIARGKLDVVRRTIETLDAAMSTRKSIIVSDEAALTAVAARVLAFEEGRAARRDEALARGATLKDQIGLLGAKYKSVDIDALTTEAKGYSDQISGATPARETYDAARNEQTRLQVQASNFAALHENDMREVKRVHAQIANAPEEMKKPCIECGKAHTEQELDEFVAHLKKRLVTLVEDAKASKAIADAANKKLVDQEAIVKAALASIPDISRAQGEYERINKILRAAGELKAHLGVMMRDYSAIIEESKGCMTEVNPHVASKEVLEARIAQSKARLQAGQEQRSKLEDKQIVAEDVCKVFSPAGVRAHVLDTVTPFLNEHTNDYLSILSDGAIKAVWSTLGETAKGEVREKFNIAVESSNGGGSFGLLSGGEKKRVRLSTMMALQDLQSSRANKPIQLFIADEIDDALDQPGLERLMMILERRARERGTVLIISHHSLSDWCSRVTTIVKCENGSVAQGALTT